MKKLMIRNSGRIIKRVVAMLVLVLLVWACRDEKVEPEFFSSISGTVLSSETNLPLSNVSITTNPSTSALLTDADGQFSISNVRIGNYTILAKKDLYTTQSLPITVQKDVPSTLSIILAKTDGGSNLSLPHDPDPPHESVFRNTLIDLSWSQPKMDDNFTYEVILYEKDNVIKNVLANGITDTLIENVEVDFATTYFWQVNTTLSNGDILQGEVWSFQTRPLPDNRYLFASTKDGKYEIYSSDTVSNTEVRLTNSNSRDWNPLWSPNKDLIAYVSNGVGSYLYTMQPNGSDKKKISNLAIDGYHNTGVGFCWSPSGGYMLFGHYDQLLRIDKQGINLDLIANAPTGRHFRQSDWTSQGNKIIVETVGSLIYDNEFYILNANGTGFQQLLGNWPGIMSSPSFSLDGKKILFTHDVSEYESTDGRQLNAHVYLMSVSDTTDIIDVSVNKPAGTNDLNPRISPDGTKVIFENMNNDNSGDKSIWIMNIDGTDRQKLFDNAEMPDYQ